MHLFYSQFNNLVADALGPRISLRPRAPRCLKPALSTAGKSSAASSWPKKGRVGLSRVVSAKCGVGILPFRLMSSYAVQRSSFRPAFFYSSVSRNDLSSL